MVINRFAVRTRWLLAFCLCAVLAAALPATTTAKESDGPPYPNAEWAAWGLSVSFANGKPIIKFGVYVGVVDDDPAEPGDQPVVLGATVETLKSPDQCNIRSASGAPNPALFIDSAGYAHFDGDIYIECEVPDWGAMVYELAPHLLTATNAECNCQGEDSFVWGSADLVIDPLPPGVSRLNPLIDASALGFAFSMPTKGTTLDTMVRTRISRSNGHVESPAWPSSASGNQLVTAHNGPFLIAVTDYFNGLPYLPNSGWKQFFINQVGSNRSGVWSGPASQGTDWLGPQGPFTVRTGENTIYIGRNDATGAMFTGRVRYLTGDPGCYAD